MQSSLVDLENFFIEWAWGKYVDTTTWLWRKKRENVFFDISWKKVKEELGEILYENETTTTQPHIIFQTRYKNKSGGVQTNRFRTEKETTSTVAVKLIKGFSRSVNASISLPLPKVEKPEEGPSSKEEGQTSEKGDSHLQVSAEFGNNVQIRCEETSVFEKKQKWTVDTTITAHEGYVTDAKLIVEEVQTKNDFSMFVRLKGTIVVNIRDKKNMNKLIDTITGDVKTLIGDLKHLDPNMADVEAVPTDSSGWVTWPFKGEMDIKYGVREGVETSATQIDDGDNQQEERSSSQAASRPQLG